MPRDMIVNAVTKGSPQWAGDFGSRDHLVPGPYKLDASQFTKIGDVKVVVGAAGAAAAATSVPVAALTEAIPSGALLDFGTNKFARLTAAAAAGAVTLTVAAIPTALVSGDTAYYDVGGIRKFVQSGTLLGRTIAERDAGTGYGPFADTDPESESFLLFFDVIDADANNDCELYRPNSQVYETYLPNFASLSATAKAMIRTRYLSTIAVD